MSLRSVARYPQGFIMSYDESISFIDGLFPFRSDNFPLGGELQTIDLDKPGRDVKARQLFQQVFPSLPIESAFKNTFLSPEAKSFQKFIHAASLSVAGNIVHYCIIAHTSHICHS